ncbi:MAG: SAVED domain-containing protein [Candidatus Eisenbacteria bacterium]|nr:SAVED domain-containing protein [Candidatus Eisenbacteria bacterium]
MAPPPTPQQPRRPRPLRRHTHPIPRQLARYRQGQHRTPPPCPADRPHLPRRYRRAPRNHRESPGRGLHPARHPPSARSQRPRPAALVARGPADPPRTPLQARLQPRLRDHPENLPLILADVLWLFRQLRDERAVTRFHLALATSAPLAFFIGRELHPFIPIDLYEHDPDTSSYRYVTTLA